VGYQVLVEIDTFPANNSPFRQTSIATNGSGIYDAWYFAPVGLTMEVNLTDLPSGIYIGRMSAQDQLLGTTRFIKKINA
jgi:hypothetical protein